MVEHAGEEAALPEPASAVEPTMEILGTLAREMLHEPADGVLHLAGDDEVNVVGHDRVTVDANLAEIGVVVQESKKLGAVLIGWVLRESVSNAPTGASGVALSGP